MKCPVCKKKISDTAAFCRHCGSPVALPLGGGMPVGAPAFCNMCGRKLAPGEVCTCTSYTPVTPEPPVFNPAPVYSEAPAPEFNPNPFSPPAGGFDEEATVSMAELSDVPSTRFCLFCGRVLHAGASCTCSDSLNAPLEDIGNEEAGFADTTVGFEGAEPVFESAEPVFESAEPVFSGAPLEFEGGTVDVSHPVVHEDIASYVPEENVCDVSEKTEATETVTSEYGMGVSTYHSKEVHSAYPGVGDSIPAPEELKINVKAAAPLSPEEERLKAEGKAFFRPAGDL